MRLVPERNEQNSNDPNILEVDSELLRDYFAGQAISCFQLHDVAMEALMQGGRPMHEVVAEFCYGLADAMLAERIKKR